MSGLNEIVASIDEALERRAREWPIRGQGWLDFRDRALAMVRALRERGLPKETLPEFGEDRMDSPVVLCGPMKSGTTLLVSLLDDHPELLAMPGDSHLASSFDAPRGLGGLGEHWVARLINPTAQPPYWFLGRGHEPYARWLALLSAAFEAERERPSREFRAVVRATAAVLRGASGGDEPVARWVEKTPENEFKVRAILGEFPRARFVYLARDPRSTMAALKVLYTTRGWTYEPDEIAARLAASLAAATGYADQLGRQRWRIVRYEELVAEPERVMRVLAEFMGVSWSASLLAPTVHGSPASNNSMFEVRRVPGAIRPARPGEDARRWIQTLSADELASVETRTSAPRRELGYE